MVKLCQSKVPLCIVVGGGYKCRQAMLQNSCGANDTIICVATLC
jgi:uridylate kinase